MKIEIYQTAEEQSKAVAGQIAAYIHAHPGCLICPAGGDTPLGAYRELIRLQEEGRVDLNDAYYVGLDEWIGLGADTAGSCRELMENNLYKPAGIREDHMAIWDGLCEDPEEECRRIEAFIRAHGGIDLTLLGIGMNAHIGFNEPGTGLQEGCLVVELSETTKSVSKKYFGKSLPVLKGFGVGAGELKKADKVILMANGAHKAEVVKRIAEGPMTEEVPATLLTDHADIVLSLDQPAADRLSNP